MLGLWPFTRYQFRGRHPMPTRPKPVHLRWRTTRAVSSKHEVLHGMKHPRIYFRKYDQEGRRRGPGWASRQFSTLFFHVIKTQFIWHFWIAGNNHRTPNLENPGRRKLFLWYQFLARKTQTFSKQIKAPKKNCSMDSGLLCTKATMVLVSPSIYTGSEHAIIKPWKGNFQD